MSQQDLAKQYEHLQRVIVFGKSNKHTYYDLLVKAKEKRDKLQGSMNSILLKADQTALPQPVFDRSDENLPPMGETSGADYAFGLVDDSEPAVKKPVPQDVKKPAVQDKKDPWTEYDPWSTEK